MQIPPLPPSIDFVALPATEAAFRFSFAVKRAAMGAVVTERWGWDEDYQQRAHRERLAEKPFCTIRDAGVPAGTISLMRKDEFIRLGEFYLMPERQRRGVGTRILRHCLLVADATGLPVRLEYLKWNPAGSLYRRNGFVVIGETDIHYQMQRSIGG
jgi:GNAT superfamily N-acetyltransferase